MDRNELRIGNIVCFISRSTKVHIPIYGFPKKIYTIGADYAKWYDYNLNEYQVTETPHAKYKNISPIPLTEEWLLRFGFVQNSGVSAREYFLNQIASIDHYESGFLILFKNNEIGTMIKYVHELQNIYFSLKKEELLLKQSNHTNNK